MLNLHKLACGGTGCTMFETRKQNLGLARTAFHTLGLIYHATVRQIRKSHGNAIIGLLINIMQTVVFVGVFYLMFEVLGMRGAKIAGADFLLYLMSGIFLFLTHNKALGAVMGAEGPASPMMQHAPMNTAIAITSAALASLYLQLLSVLVVLFIYHIAFTPVVIIEPSKAMAMLLLAWVSGCAIGLLFLAIKPWSPGFVNIASQLYTRANMITSGKMFVANTLPSFMIAMFDWNPLFHCIDQIRGFVFLNYTPRHTSIEYAVFFTLGMIMLGMLGEFYTRKFASLSWGAKR